MEKLLKCAHNWLLKDKRIVLAVVTETWGSAPRPRGSLMVIHEEGHFEGSVSGGCVEGSVIAEAGALIGKQSSKTLEFTVASEDAWQVGLACGGKIQVQLFPLDKMALPALRQSLLHFQNRRSGKIILKKQDVSLSFRENEKSDSHPETPNDQPSRASSHDVNLEDNSDALILPVEPKCRLFIVGAVHIAQALTPMAVACGYDVTVVDPRGLFVEERHFAGACVINDWPDDFFKKTPLDARSALVTLTHDPKIDDVALDHALGTDAFYIGSLGSKKTHAARLGRLEKKGFTPETLERIHGPIGLKICSKSPAEIAVSIMGELTANRRGTPCNSRT